MSVMPRSILEGQSLLVKMVELFDGIPNQKVRSRAGQSGKRAGPAGDRAFTEVILEGFDVGILESE